MYNTSDLNDHPWIDNPCYGCNRASDVECAKCVEKIQEAEDSKLRSIMAIEEVS